MKKLLKWLAGILVTLVLLVVLAIIALPLVFDPNEHKPYIQQIAADNIGREVALNGPIEWSVFPWVAINLNDVTVANADGFKGEYLAHVNQVAVKVKLLPLLKKQIQVGEVVLNQPEIKLQVARSGSTNWQSILDHLESGSSESTADADSADLEIRGISLTDGQLTYIDASADLAVELTQLNFSSDAIKAGVPTPMSLQSQLSLVDQDLSGEIEANWQATDITSGDGMIMNFDDFSFSGLAAEVPVRLASKGAFELNLAQDGMTMEQLTLSHGPVNLTTPVMGKNITGNRALSGELVLDEFELDEWLRQNGSPLDNQANNVLSGKMQWSLTGDRLQMNQIQAQLDETRIQGSIDLQQLSQMQGRFDLTVDQINLDQYLPAEEAAGDASSGTASDEATVDFGRLNGQIKIQQMQAAGVQLSDITLNIKTQGPNLWLEPLNAGFYQGLLKTELRLQPKNTGEQLTVSHSMQNFQAGGLLTDLMGTDYLTGLGQLNANITVAEPFSERPLQTANGQLSYQLTDGDIVGIDVFEIMQQSLSLLNKTEAASANADLKTSFGLMDIQADVTNGVLQTNKLRLTSPYFDLKGEVTIDLDQQTIQGTIKPMLTNIPQGVLDQNFEKLIDVRIPVKLSGSLLEPAVSVDVAQLLLETQKAKIDEKKDELKEDLFDALLGSKKDKKTSDQSNEQPDGSQSGEMTEKQKRRAEKDRQKRALLEGLFKNIDDKDKKEDKEKDPDGDT